ncbi:putative membrane protein, partial [Acinetobacter baumannii 25766_1]
MLELFTYTLASKLLQSMVYIFISILLSIIT